MTPQAFAGLRVVGGTGAATEDTPREWTYVPFDTTVPMSYWAQGSDTIPKAVSDRVTRLGDYADLYHGDYANWLQADERTVSKNWFGDIAQVYADFMVASPPVWFIGDRPLAETGLFPEASMRSFEGVTEQIIRDQVAYGTALADVADGEVTRVHPRLWYPTGGDGDVTAGTAPDGSGFLVKFYLPGGIVQRLRFALDSASLQGSLGVPDEIEETIVGDPAAWDVILERTDGRAVTLTPCPREPAEGDWGWRLWEDLAKLVFDYNRRLSRRSLSIDRHEDPIMMAVREPADEEVTAPRRPKIEGQSTQEETVQVRTVNSNLAQWRGQAVGIPPEGISGFEYLSFEGDYAATADALADLRKDIISTSRLPASLLGIDDLRLGSGVALRVSHSQTYLTMQTMQENLVQHLRRILLILALDLGTSGPTLDSFADGLRVEWANPVDFLEEGQSMETTDGGEEDGGESESDIVEALALEEMAGMSAMERAAFQRAVTASMDRSEIGTGNRSRVRRRALAQRANG